MSEKNDAQDKEEIAEQGTLHRYRDELELTGRYEVARRHFAIDLFDGVLPILGIIAAGILVMGTQDSFLVFETTLLAALGTSIAHFMAGFSASYLTESAEGTSIIENFERGERRKISHAVSLNHRIIVRAERETTILVSLVNGITPAGAILLAISPMLLSLAGLLDHVTSFYTSLMVGLILLTLLGAFLGRISRGSTLRFISKTLVAGLLTMLLMIPISLLAGAG
jgi:predicted membrane protein (TIGR00267 family)